MAQRPDKDGDVEDLMGMNDAGDHDGPALELEDGADGVGDAAPQERPDESIAEQPRQKNAAVGAEPAHAEIERQADPLGHIVIEDRLQTNADDRRAPDDQERPPAPPAEKQDAVHRREGAGDEDEDRTVIEPAENIPGRAAAFHHVVNAAHREHEDAGRRINAKRDEAPPIAAAAQQQAIAEKREQRGADEMAHGAERLFEAGQAINVEDRADFGIHAEQERRGRVLQEDYERSMER